MLIVMPKTTKNICNDNTLESMFDSSESDAKYSVYKDDGYLDKILEG
jgi:hypothetical protein